MAGMVCNCSIDFDRVYGDRATLCSTHEAILRDRIQNAVAAQRAIPIPMLLNCPACGDRHLDVGEFASKPHHTHACQHCGMVWRPAVLYTVGVQFLPGFKNKE